MKRITIVEDDNFMREELQYCLEQEGYVVQVVQDFSTTVETIMEQMPDLLLLDVTIPGKNGFAVCKEIKERTSISVVVLTSRNQLKDELEALNLGADEYLTKPCHRDRLLARIRKLEKRTEWQSHFIKGGGMALDRHTGTLYVGEDSARLTGQETEILAQLLKHPGEMVPKEQLFQVLWGTREYVDENALQVAMVRLRKRLTGMSVKANITTVRGKGYRMEW